MSDRDEWPANPNDPPPKRAAQWEERPAQGGCLKFALIIAALTGAMMLFCCGGVVWIGWGFVPKIAATPAEVKALGEQAMKIDIPPEFTADTGFSMDNWLLTMQMANYKHKDGGSVLLIGSLQIKFGDVKDQKDLFKKQTNKHSEDAFKLDVKSTVEKEFTIRGTPTKFLFSEAVKAGNAEKMRVVSSEFTSPSGITMFHLVLKEETYDEEAVIKLIESIR
jgi:hypothetical protein